MIYTFQRKINKKRILENKSFKVGICGERNMKFIFEKDNIIYAKCTNCDRILKFKRFELEEVKTGVECFCGNISNSIDGVPEKIIATTKSNEKKESVPKPSVSTSSIQMRNTPSKTGPICPTCGSRNVSKITLTSKAVGGAMFGIFSSNIRNTFKCNNCGYKW